MAAGLLHDSKAPDGSVVTWLQTAAGLQTQCAWPQTAAKHGSKAANIGMDAHISSRAADGDVHGCRQQQSMAARLQTAAARL